MTEHEQPNCGRQVSETALPVNRGEQLRNRFASVVRDVFERTPKRVLEADAGLMAIDHNGSFHDCRFHCIPRSSIIGQHNDGDLRLAHEALKESRLQVIPIVTFTKNEGRGPPAFRAWRRQRDSDVCAFNHGARI